MVTLDDAEGVARQMVSKTSHPEIQIAQTYYRMQLVEGWQIPPGARVLEIGCGQGDMTAALAHAVGDGGHVTAVDIAPTDYGTPISLGESADHLKSMLLGQRIEFHFECDVMDPAISFQADAFDYVVLAHCSWYFPSLDHLRRLLLRIKPWARRLCFAEWDLEPRTLDQIAHLLAVLIQGQVAAYHIDTASNVLTPFSRIRLLQLLQETAWNVSTEFVVDATQLQDGEWEIDNCLWLSIADAETSNMPEKLLELLHNQVDILRSVASRGENHALPSYSMLAEKS